MNNTDYRPTPEEARAYEVLLRGRADRGDDSIKWAMNTIDQLSAENDRLSTQLVQMIGQRRDETEA